MSISLLYLSSLVFRNLVSSSGEAFFNRVLVIAKVNPFRGKVRFLSVNIMAILDSFIFYLIAKDYGIIIEGIEEHQIVVSTPKSPVQFCKEISKNFKVTVRQKDGFIYIPSMV